MTGPWVKRCRELSGVPTLSPRLVASLVERAQEQFGADVMRRVLELVDVRSDAAALQVARCLVYGLYTGILPQLGGESLRSGNAPRDLRSNNELDYFEAAVWRVIQAHPPALSGGYFGHWHYPPEDAP